MKLKELIETRNMKLEEMKNLSTAIETEKRAFTEEEAKSFDELEAEVRSIDATIEQIKRAEDLEQTEVESEDSAEELKPEERAFAAYVREVAGGVQMTEEQRANMSMGDNGAVIPETIAQKIIKAVVDLCPIYAQSTIYNVKGTLKVPVWGADGTDITVGFQSEFTDITSSTGKFTSVDLGGFLAGALTIIGKSVINNADVDIVSFIVNQMAQKIAEFLENKLLNGDASYNEGALATSNGITAAAATVITADELIDVQAKVKQAFQAKACWVMAPETFTAVKKLKDGNNRYLLQDDVTGEFPYRLLGKPVYVSDNMPAMTTGNKAVLYGDLSGLSVNMRENIEIQILNEKYATQHAVGVVAWFEFDSKVTENQKLAAITMA